MKNILIIGALGQLGSELADTLKEHYGEDHVLRTDIREENGGHANYKKLDACDAEAVRHIVKHHQITDIYHLAAVLSAKGEQQPLWAWDLNMKSLLIVLETAREFKCKVFWPSSIAVFGPDTPKIETPQYTLMNPTTVYGISKLAGERWCEYYNQKYGVDVRSLRYPGLIGYKSLPGGGTTDYAVDIFFKAIANHSFDCFLSANTRLPMLYMQDAIEATLQLMRTPAEKIKIRSSYNLAGMSFTPEELYVEIKKSLPKFTISYSPDYRQAIADSWPQSIDDTFARKEWGWKPSFDIVRMTDHMLTNIASLAI